MGAVYVRVRLSNAGDVEKARTGQANQETVRTIEVDALVNTGSTRSAVPPAIVESLGLTIMAQAVGKLPDDSSSGVGICSPIGFEIMGRETFEEAYVMGDEILIGLTTLEATDLVVDCKNQRVIGKHAEGPVYRLSSSLRRWHERGTSRYR
jgi:clan AA aspartic protease